MAEPGRIALAALEAVERIEDQAVLDMERTLRRLERLLVERITEDDITKTTDIALATENVQGVLRESGYYREVGDLLNTDYQRVVDEAHRQYREIYGESFRFAPATIEEMNAIKASDLKEFNRLGDKMADEISRGIVDLRFGAVTRKQLIDDILARSVDVNGNHVKTWIRTGTAGFYNEANVKLAADAGLDRFRYSGPVNPGNPKTGAGRTRPFCRKYAGQVKTIEQWDALAKDPLRKGQPLPVHRYLGGFNCIHTLVAVA